MNGFADDPRPKARHGCDDEDAERAPEPLEPLEHEFGMWELWPRPRFVTFPGRSPVDLEALSDVILD